MNAAIRFPIYRTEDMQKERPVVDGEFQRAESDPVSRYGMKARKNYGATWLQERIPSAIIM
jgi:zinc protease